MGEPVITVHPPPRIRRTPALTRQARDLFEWLIRSDGWQPGATIPRIARETGLSEDQVRDAIFAPSADAWRHEMTARFRRTPSLF